MTEDNFSDYMMIKEAAAFLGVSAETLRNWDRAGKLPAYRNPFNGYRLYKLDDLKRLLKEIRQQDESAETE